MKTIFVLLVVTIHLFATAFSQSSVTITDCNLNGWTKTQTPPTSTVALVNGPSTPILGNGSVRFTSNNRIFSRLRYVGFSGTPLSSVTEFSFSTFVERSDTIADNAFIVLQSDINGDGRAEHNLVFDQRYQSGRFAVGIVPDQGPTIKNTWQTWDALHGGWFVNAGVTIDPDNGGELLSLATYIRRYPNATIRNDVVKGDALRVGSGGPIFRNNFIGYFDNLKFGVNGVTTTYDFEGSISNAGVDQTIIYGYGSNCTTLNGTGAGGFTPYSYSWSNGGVNSVGQNLSVCPTTATTYTLTVTDARACTGTDQVTVFLNDVRCGNKNDKVLVCHKGEKICIPSEAVNAHLKHGDNLGSCSSTITTQANSRMQYSVPEKPKFSEPEFKVSNYPNPFAAVTQIQYQLPVDCNVSIIIYNLQGRMIATPLFGNKKAGLHTIDFNSKNLKPGTYYYRISARSPTRSFSKSNKMVVLH